MSGQGVGVDAVPGGWARVDRRLREARHLVQQMVMGVLGDVVGLRR